ncbi:MAG TPA: transcription termination factor Rho [Candidatus Wallbacteria bacterium]|nr:transcription termination factor Rho [Candidatus Wallbacteria bacterium]
MARGFTIQDLNKKNVSELFQIAQDLNITPHLHKRTNTLIMRIMHEQIKRAGGYAAEGVLDILEDGYGFLRTATYSINEKDVYVSPSQIRRFDLRTGDVIIGQTRAPKEGEKFAALLRIEAINFEEPEKIKHRKNFDTLVPYYPNEKFTLEKKADYGDLSTRIVDLISPVGKGQRGLIVAPPKAGKTTLLKSMANSIIENHPEVEVMILLIDERPEEVTDMQRSVNAEVISSTFDEPLEHHIRVSELTLEKAKRMVENNKHVVILLDSITRLARAYNLHLPSSGQTLTGGVNPAALYKPKKFFGAARNIEGGGSLTILATALVETGSKLDDIIFEEFKGTGNMELILDRKLFEKRLFPCMDIKRTGTRKEELLLDKDTLNKVWILRKILEPLSPAEAMQLMVDRMSKTKRNKDFLESMHVADAN